MVLWCGSSAWRSPCSTFVREIVVWRTNLEVTPALETIGMEGEGGTIAVGAEHAELHPVRIAQLVRGRGFFVGHGNSSPEYWIGPVPARRGAAAKRSEEVGVGNEWVGT